MTTLDAYLRHARKFGTECVYETAGELSSRDRRRLRIELDAIDAEQAARAHRYRRPPHRRRATVETREAVLQLRAEGLVVSAVAAKLGVTVKTVRRYLNSENGSAKPHGYAAKRALKPNLA